MIKIGPSDRDWLNSRFSALNVISPREMRGEFDFRASLVDKTARCVQPHYEQPDEAVRGLPGFIEDRFHIRVRFPEGGAPEVWEIGGRLCTRCQKLMARGDAKGMADMHVYPQRGNACLGHPHYLVETLRQQPEVGEFIEQFLIPYFYFHGYWEKYGEQPWEGLSHDLGLATLQQIASDENRVAVYADCIRSRVASGIFCSQFITEATPDAKKGMEILLKWLKSQGESEMLSHLRAINLTPPDAKR